MFNRMPSVIFFKKRMVVYTFPTEEFVLSFHGHRLVKIRAVVAASIRSALYRAGVDVEKVKTVEALVFVPVVVVVFEFEILLDGLAVFDADEVRSSLDFRDVGGYLVKGFCILGFVSLEFFEEMGLLSIDEVDRGQWVVRGRLEELLRPGRLVFAGHFPEVSQLRVVFKFTDLAISGLLCHALVVQVHDGNKI